MSDGEPREVKGLYHQLPDALFEEARLLNRSFNLRSDAEALDEEVAELRKNMGKDFHKEIASLIEVRDLLKDEELLSRYEASLLLLRRNSESVYQFKCAMNLRAQLEPGVMLRTEPIGGGAGSLITIKDREIHPSLELYNGSPELLWTVSVEEYAEPETIGGGMMTRVGKEALLDELDKYVGSNFGERRLGIKLPYISTVISDYEKLGQSDKAAQLRERAVMEIRGFLLMGNSSEVQGQSVKPKHIQYRLEAFSEIDPEGYAAFIEESLQDSGLLSE